MATSRVARELIAVAADTCSQSRPFRVHCASRCAATPLRPPARRTLSHHEEIPMSPVTTASGLTIEDTVIGEGETPPSGRDVILHDAGRLAHRTPFHSSKVNKDPITFPLRRR